MATKRKRVDPPQPPATDERCPSCGGHVMVHWGQRSCTVPGCEWKSKPKA